MKSEVDVEKVYSKAETLGKVKRSVDVLKAGKTFTARLGFERKISLLFITLIFLFICRDYSLLFQTHVATGIDGYYYILQIDSLLNIRRLYFPTNTPLILYFLAILSLLYRKNHCWS